MNILTRFNINEQRYVFSSLISCFRCPRIIIIVISAGFLSIAAISTLIALSPQPSFSEIISFGNNGTARSNCNCVVFRLDDIQDYWIRSAQLAVMNQFKLKNQSLTLGIIMNSIGNDSEIINNLKQGSDSGLFELAVHGWNHAYYTQLSQGEQKNSLIDSSTKMIRLFGKTSEIFIPPFDAFNDDTIIAMKQADMKILAGNRSSFNELKLSGNNTELQTSLSTAQSKDILYIPATISFKDYYGGKYLRNSLQDIFNNATKSVAAYGYAVIVIHPQDFMVIDANGNLTNVLDDNEINDLSRLIDMILSNNTYVKSFYEITTEIPSKERIVPSSNSIP